MVKEVYIPSIHCSNCAETIKRELEELPGVREVTVDLVAKKARIHWNTPMTWEQIALILQEIGFPAVL